MNEYSEGLRRKIVKEILYPNGVKKSVYIRTEKQGKDGRWRRSAGDPRKHEGEKVVE